MVPPYSVNLTRGPTYSSILSTYIILDTGLSPFAVSLSRLFSYDIYAFGIRALPVSLATTSRISVDFFSSGYLDVSVPRVRFTYLFYSVLDTKLTLGGLPHSDIFGSQFICQLPEAFRRLSRLSSPLTAKASALCTLFFDHITSFITSNPFTSSQCCPILHSQTTIYIFLLAILRRKFKIFAVSLLTVNISFYRSAPYGKNPFTIFYTRCLKVRLLFPLIIKTYSFN